MKILFVHSARFVQTPDGVVFSDGQFPYRHWERYIKHFDEVIVICRMAPIPEAPRGWNVSSGPKVIFVGTPDDHGKPLMQLQTGKARKIIREQLMASDAVIIRQSILGWIAAEEADRHGTPWAVEVVGDVWNALWHYGTWIGKLYAPIGWWSSRKWIARARYAIYVTRDYLQAKYPCKGTSRGVSDVYLEHVPMEVLDRRIDQWDISTRQKSGIFVIGLIGSLFNRYKGLHVALKALKILNESGIKCELHVLGNGHLNAWKMEADRLGVGNFLHLDGSLPNGGPVMEWLDRLDFYIQPSLTEGLPRAVIEAMSRGLPVLGSRCGGIPELLDKDCLHKPGDYTTLADQLRRMVSDKAWRIQQAKRNFMEAQNYTVERLNAQRDEFWDMFAASIKK